MKIERTLVSTLALTLALGVVGCGDDDERGPAGPEGPPGAEGPAGPEGQQGDQGDPGDIEGSVSGVTPGYLFLDRVETVNISGYGTEWEGNVTVNFGAGIDVLGVQVASPTGLLAVVDIDGDDAATGVRDVTVTHGGETHTYAGAVVVAEPLELLDLAGTPAQGSVLLATLFQQDSSTPFDQSLLSVGIDEHSWGYSLGGGLYLAQGLVFVDVTGPTGEFDIFTADAAFSRARGAVEVAARTATTLPYDANDAVMVTLSEPFESALYQVTVPAGALVLLGASSDDPYASPYAALLPASGSFADLISFGDYVFPGVSYQWFGSNEATTFYTVAVDFSGEPSELELFTIEGATGWVFEVEPNDDFGDAQELPRGETELLGRISSSSDFDVFEVEAEAGDEIEVEVFALLTGCASEGIQAHIEIFDENGELVAESSPFDSCGSVLATGLAEATYYIRVRPNVFCGGGCSFAYGMYTYVGTN